MFPPPPLQRLIGPPPVHAYEVSVYLLVDVSTIDTGKCARAMPTQPNSNQQLEVLERNEVYEDSDEGFHFAGTLVVYQTKGYLYHAMLKACYSSSSNINAEDFKNVTQIPRSAYNPNILSSLRQRRKLCPTITLSKGLN
ncbi:hypothetical protein BJX99DRAFT_220100 [Aspergillus californicus]